MDALCTPTIGIVSDKTRSKYGRRKFWHLIGSIAGILSFPFILSDPCTTFESWGADSRASPSASAAAAAPRALDFALGQRPHYSPPARTVVPAAADVRSLGAAAACDLESCVCDGVDLSSLRGTVYSTPKANDGYVFNFTLCNEIPAFTLPSACTVQSEHPAAIKMKVEDDGSVDDSDCEEVGSLGCATDDCPEYIDDCECGMSGTALPDGTGVDVTFSYWYGCQYALTLRLTVGSTQAQPGRVEEEGDSGCRWRTNWPVLPEIPQPEPEPAPAPGHHPHSTPDDSTSGCTSWGQTEYLLWYGFFVSVFQFGWASVQTTHLALAREVTAGCGEEAGVSLYSTRYGAGIISTLIVYMLAWVLLNDSTGNDVTRSDAPQFFLLSIFATIIGGVLVAVFHIFTVEPESQPEEEESNPGAEGSSSSSSGLDPSSIAFWSKEPTVWCMSLVYSSSRVVVNLSQTYLPLYLLTTLHLDKSAIATVPLVVYSSGLVASQLNEALNERLGREKAYGAGMCCALVALLIFLMIQPEPEEPEGEGTYSCGLSGAHLCIPWVYFAAVILGFGCSVLLPTAQSMVSEMIPDERKESTATVWGCMSFVDKIMNGVVIWLCQYAEPICEGEHGDSDACSGCVLTLHCTALRCAALHLAAVQYTP